MNSRLHGVLFATALLAASGAQAYSISAVPSSTDVIAGDSFSVTLSMNFEAASVGGGLIFDFAGPISFTGFTPSAYFNTLNTAPADDTDFTGFGTSTKPADAEFEIHFGSFSGISGNNVLGTLNFSTQDGNTGTGLITVAESPSNFYGGFLDLAANPLTVTYPGQVQVNVNPIPLPATVWMFFAAMGAAATRLRRRA